MLCRLVPLLIIAATACSAPTESCAPPANITGTWSYAAEQQAGGAVTLTGTLSVERQSCRDFDGSMDVVQVDARGQRSRLTGRVTGRLLDAKSVQFDALLNVVPRQHLATINGDSLTGSWLEIATGAAASGSFRGKRTVTQ